MPDASNQMPATRKSEGCAFIKMKRKSEFSGSWSLAAGRWPLASAALANPPSRQ
jgi:hypothetical protein